MTKKQKPSAAQRRVLEAMRDGLLVEHDSMGRGWFTFAGISRGHPAAVTVKTMLRAGWIDKGESKRVGVLHYTRDYALTALGRAALLA